MSWGRVSWRSRRRTAHVFGEPYASHFGREVVRSAPAAVVEELGPNQFSLQLTDDLADVSERYDEFETRRESVKRHLGKTAFFDPDSPPFDPYELPFGPRIS